MSVRNLDKLFAPRSVALIGASSRPGSLGETLLRNLQAGTDPDNKVRIAVYGGSHTQADIYTGYLRTYLQERFGNGGYGFLPLVKDSDFTARSRSW